jgi:hypothetical protein
MENRCIWKFLQLLRKENVLHSRHYFWVVEFQEETQQAHWHLLVDSDFVEHGLIFEAWSKFRPKAAPKIERVTRFNYHGREPALGSVFFSSQCDPARAAWYASEYLVKYPAYGFPEWCFGEWAAYLVSEAVKDSFPARPSRG